MDLLLNVLFYPMVTFNILFSIIFFIKCHQCNPAVGFILIHWWLPIFLKKNSKWPKLLHEEIYSTCTSFQWQAEKVNFCWQDNSTGYFLFFSSSSCSLQEVPQRIIFLHLTLSPVSSSVTALCVPSFMICMNLHCGLPLFILLGRSIFIILCPVCVYLLYV